MKTLIASEARYGVIVAADMTVGGDRAFRIALEVRHYASLGATVGLLHSKLVGDRDAIVPEIAACVRRGSASVVDPQGGASAGLVILHAPSELGETFADLSRIAANKLIVVSYQETDYALDSLVLRLPKSAETRWAPIDGDVRLMAPASKPKTRLNWLPPAAPQDNFTLPQNAARGAIGWLVSDNSASPPYESPLAAELFALMLGSVRPPIADESRRIDLGAGHLSLSRLVSRLSALAFFPDETPATLPDALILTALRAGKPVALPPHLRARYGTGPIYCAKDDALLTLTNLLTDPSVLQRHCTRTAKVAASSYQTALPVLKHSEPNSTGHENAPARPIMYVIGGGTGVGHVARLLAIARRMDPDVPAIFVCQAHAVSAIEKLGYMAEYIPSANYVGGSRHVWDQWLQHRLDVLINDYDPSLVVFDGNHLYPGLIRAVASRPDCKLAWVRRGLWGKTFSPYMASSRWCDLIVEPGELTGQPDGGATALRREEATIVPPIRLLEQAELLTRAEAAKALGLDPAAPAVLVQLGVNSTRETVSLIDAIVRELRKFAGLQICVAEFAGLESEVGYWPGVTFVRGFPLSQYLRAFDFSVAAAGYNTFHEVIGFALPTIFIPNRDPSMDDQAGRAAFAQNSEAAFELDEEGFDDLPNLIKLLLEPKGRNYLAGNCEKIRLPNGAQAAAAALGHLMGAGQ